MRPVQLILALLVLGMLALYFNRLRSGIMDRVVVLAFGLLGLIMVAIPDATTRVANWVGVGRGSDLFIYLALVGFAFIFLLLYSKIRDLESTITRLTRTVAINNARDPEDRGGVTD